MFRSGGPSFGIGISLALYGLYFVSAIGYRQIGKSVGRSVGRSVDKLRILALLALLASLALLALFGTFWHFWPFWPFLELFWPLYWPTIGKKPNSVFGPIRDRLGTDSGTGSYLQNVGISTITRHLRGLFCLNIENWTSDGGYLPRFIHFLSILARFVVFIDFC